MRKLTRGDSPCGASNQVKLMNTYHAINTGHLQRRSRTFWLLSWFLVTLYLVASGRAFIPGICATQRALDAQQVSDSGAPSIHALRACCVFPRAKDRESGVPVAPRESGCALCTLVSSPVPLVATVFLPVPPKSEFAALQAEDAQCTGTCVDSAFQTRAPPSLTHRS